MTIFKSFLKDEIQGHSGPILGSATNIPFIFYLFVYLELTLWFLVNKIGGAHIHCLFPPLFPLSHLIL